MSDDLVDRLRNPMWVHGMESEPFLCRDQTLRDLSDAADEILRLRDIIERARLAVTVAGLTIIGYSNACKQAREILNECR